MVVQHVMSHRHKMKFQDYCSVYLFEAATGGIVLTYELICTEMFSFYDCFQTDQTLNFNNLKPIISEIVEAGC